MTFQFHFWFFPVCLFSGNQEKVLVITDCRFNGDQEKVLVITGLDLSEGEGDICLIQGSPCCHECLITIL